MRKTHWLLMAALMFAPIAAHAQLEVTKLPGPPLKRTYVPLGGQATGIMTEPVTPDPVKSHIAVIVVHPGHGSMVNQFVAQGLPKYGYRTLAIAYNGGDRDFYDLLAPVAAGIKALRAMPGVDKVVLSGNSTGGAEITSYEDVAENGPAACQRPERLLKCTTAQATNLPKADALMLLDGNSGSPEGTMDFNPAVDPKTHAYNPALDLFAPQNGYNPTTGEANYSPAFLKKFFAAQAALVNHNVDVAVDRWDKIQKGQGEYRVNEPYTPCCRGVFASEVKPEIAYINLLSQTHAPHMLIKTDGTRPVQIITEVRYPEAQINEGRPALGEGAFLAPVKRPANTPHEYPGPDGAGTVRNYLSGAVRLTADYHWTKDNAYGIDYHSSPESAPGSIQGIHIPTLVMAGTCAVHITWLEITYDLSPAKDKEYVAVEGAQHEFEPCKPQYAGSFKRAFDYVDSWLSKPGRL